MEALKRAVRILVHHPRAVYHYNFEDVSDKMTMCAGTDFAGCTKTRSSTSGGIIFLSTHLVKHWSSTQSTIALSSGEAELTGNVKGAANALGLQALARDLGFDVAIELKSDATAAIGICRRRERGKVRHSSVSDLWAQERVRGEDLQLTNILGHEIPADMLKTSRTS